MVSCRTTAAAADDESVTVAARVSRDTAGRAGVGGGAKWVKMYRITETVDLELAYPPPDYLRDHNSADAIGSASFLTWAVVEVPSAI